MIQRIQSIFLLLNAIVMGINFKLPFATSSNTAQTLFADGLYNVNDNHIILGLVGLSIVLSLIIMFLFKNRKLQLKLSLVSFIVIGALIGLLVLDFSKFQEYTIGLGTGSPVCALIFSTLAYIYIKKDDKLVKSMDRLR